MNCGKTLIIGISGPSNSGKTSLTSRLQKSLPGSSHICQDTYFHSPGDDRLTWVPEVQHHNWELFCVLDMDTMVTDVKRWKYKQQDQDKPSILLIEGFTIFNYGSLTKLLDKRYFLMASKEVCEMRRLTRHYNPPDVAGYFDKVVWPHYVQTYNDIRDNPNIVFIEEGLTTEEIFMKVKNDIEHCLQIS